MDDETKAALGLVADERAMLERAAAKRRALGNSSPESEYLAKAMAAEEIEADRQNPKNLPGAAKVPMSSIPASALIQIAGAMAHGDQKYGRYSWRGAENKHSTYIDAALRHIVAANDGAHEDPETGVPHYAHAAACLCILLDLEACGDSFDDRVPGPAQEVLDASGAVPRVPPPTTLDAVLAAVKAWGYAIERVDAGEARDIDATARRQVNE